MAWPAPPPAPEEDEDARPRRRGGLWSTLALALLAAATFRSCLAQPFIIPSGSMEPTLLVGDYLIVDKTAYGWSRHSFPFSLPVLGAEGRVWERLPRRGDVAVFRLPADPGVDYVKRVIGLPGDEIVVRGGRVVVNGAPLLTVPAPPWRDDTGTLQRVERETSLDGARGWLTLDKAPATGALDDAGPFLVPERHVFVMGDNRDDSEDSRVAHKVGPVPLDNLVGRGWLVLFSRAPADSWLDFALRPQRAFKRVE